MIHHGSCHCGNIRYTFETARAISELPFRRCGCTFCTKQGAVYASDPNGKLNLEIADGDKMTRYRFGLKTADFLSCQQCGGFVAVVAVFDGQLKAVLNINTFDDLPSYKIGAVTVLNYDGETLTERLARRARNWMPAAGIEVVPVA